MSRGANVSIKKKGEQFRVEVHDNDGKLLAFSPAMTHEEAIYLKASLDNPGNPMEYIKEQEYNV